jgi:hypothetical protein
VWGWNAIFELVEEFFTRVRVTPIYDDMRDQLNP